MLSRIFQRASKDIPQNRLIKSHVQSLFWMTIPYEDGHAGYSFVPEGGDPSSCDKGRYDITVQDDGKLIEIKIDKTRDGVDYSTYIRGREVVPGTIDIEEFTFDNEEWPLTNAKNIFAALEFEGRNVKWMSEKRAGDMTRLPNIHQGSKEFSKTACFFRRFLPI